MGNFQADVLVGSKASHAVAQVFVSRDYKVRELDGKNALGCDIIMVSPQGVRRTVEVKCNKGVNAYGTHYDTFCLELSRDAAGTDLPEWRRFPVDWLIEVDMSTATAHVFDGKKLRQFAENIQSSNVDTIRAGVAIGQSHITNPWEKAGSVCVKVPWKSKEAGHVASFPVAF